MEEKERFTFDTSSMCFYDKRTNISINYNNYELLCNILNQQDKEIKKLEEYNNKYPYHYSEEYMKNNRKLEAESKQLKQKFAITEKALELACETLQDINFKLYNTEMNFVDFFKQQAKEMLENE